MPDSQERGSRFLLAKQAVIEVNPVDCWELDLKEDRAKLLVDGAKSPQSGCHPSLVSACETLGKIRRIN